MSRLMPQQRPVGSISRASFAEFGSAAGHDAAFIYARSRMSAAATRSHPAMRPPIAISIREYRCHDYVTIRTCEEQLPRLFLEAGGVDVAPEYRPSLPLRRITSCISALYYALT